MAGPLDLGGWISWTSPGRYVTVDVSLVTGEGQHGASATTEGRRRHLIVRPLAFMEEAPIDLEAGSMRERVTRRGQSENHAGARLTARHARGGRHRRDVGLGTRGRRRTAADGAVDVCAHRSGPAFPRMGTL